jgi:hypothetical protein
MTDATDNEGKEKRTQEEVRGFGIWGGLRPRKFLLSVQGRSARRLIEN